MSAGPVRCPRCPEMVPAPAGRKYHPRILALGGLLLAGMVVGLGCRGGREKEEEGPAQTDAGKKDKAAYRALAALPKTEQAKVERAVDRGIQFLKDALDEKKTKIGKDVVDTSIGPVSINHPGAMALAGLTLRACGVRAEDPALARVLTTLRTYGREPEYTHTYTLSLTILCLDQNGDRRDRRLIQALALRLIAGQRASGAWGYKCPALSEDDEEALRTLLDDLGKTGGKPVPEGDPRLKKFKDLPVVQYRPGQNVGDRQGPPGRVGSPDYDDNSNTQFAILALWAARKSQVPAARSLLFAEAHFRATQNEDGSWGYYNRGKVFPDSMTCAGLLGLALGHGVRGSEKSGPITEDPQVKKALAYLGGAVGKPLLPEEPTNTEYRRGKWFGSLAEEDLFFLWSLERVAVLYDLRQLAGKEWYPWGVRILLQKQRTDGAWLEHYGTVPDTCFALLFLERANVARDLTSKLRLPE